MREEEIKDGPKRRTLGLSHTRTIKMSDDILAAKVTPNGRLIALALLDSTVQVGFHAHGLSACAGPPSYRSNGATGPMMVAFEGRMARQNSLAFADPVSGQLQAQGEFVRAQAARFGLGRFVG